MKTSKKQSRKKISYDDDSQFKFALNQGALNRRRSSSFTEGVQVFRNQTRTSFSQQTRNSITQRKRSIFPYFAEAPGNEESEVDEGEFVYRDHYRKVLRQIYEEEERELLKRCCKPKKMVYNRIQSASSFDSFRQFLIDNEILVQILIVLPLVLTALYILLVEKGSLVNTSP